MDYRTQSSGSASPRLYCSTRRVWISRMCRSTISRRSATIACWTFSSPRVRRPHPQSEGRYGRVHRAPASIRLRRLQSPGGPRRSWQGRRGTTTIRRRWRPTRAREVGPRPDAGDQDLERRRSLATLRCRPTGHGGRRTTGRQHERGRPAGPGAWPRVSLSDNGRVRLGIEAPRQIRIDRAEVLDRIRKENLEAGEAAAPPDAHPFAAYATRRANERSARAETEASTPRRESVAASR